MNAELLAPAGGEEQLIAAVRCGADAVYLGTKAFNARRNAGNFLTGKRFGGRFPIVTPGMSRCM